MKTTGHTAVYARLWLQPPWSRGAEVLSGSLPPAESGGPPGRVPGREDTCPTPAKPSYRQKPWGHLWERFGCLGREARRKILRGEPPCAAADDGGPPEHGEGSAKARRAQWLDGRRRPSQPAKSSICRSMGQQPSAGTPARRTLLPMVPPPRLLSGEAAWLELSQPPARRGLQGAFPAFFAG